MCDMDRLGRNEFIGEVRVALKKLKDGESKKYYMGLERIAQVCACACVCACVCVCVCVRACVRARAIVAVVRLRPLEFVLCII